MTDKSQTTLELEEKIKEFNSKDSYLSFDLYWLGELVDDLILRIRELENERN